MTVVLWVGVALLGGLGSVLRLLVDETVRARVPADGFPTGILVVNLSGAAVLGLLSGLALDHDASLLLGTALVGAYTTFSTWMLDTVNAAGARMASFAVLNVVMALCLGFAAASLGRALGAGL